MPPESSRGARAGAPRDVSAAGEQLDVGIVGQPSPLVDDREACRTSGVSRATWWKLHSQGRIPLPVRLGRRTLWRRRELHDWIDAGCPSRDRWRWPLVQSHGRRP